jgi:hypothetical protein
MYVCKGTASDYGGVNPKFLKRSFYNSSQSNGPASDYGGGLKPKFLKRSYFLNGTASDYGGVKPKFLKRSFFLTKF